MPIQHTLPQITKGPARTHAGMPTSTCKPALKRTLICILFATIFCVFFSQDAYAQARAYELREGRWTLSESQPRLGTDPDLIQAKELLATGQDSSAVARLDAWFIANPDPRGTLVPEALILRGDSHLAGGDEYSAMIDYERVAREFAGTDALPVALERELRIANLYLAGMRVKSWWFFRIDSGVPLAEEIIIRINERLPGSRLAEQALLDLAEYYYRSRELRQAADTYEIFMKLYPKSDKRELAMQRRLYANIAQFKGPRYDASSLTDAKVQIEDYAAEFPSQAREKGLDDALTARMDESLAEEALESAKWYMRTDDAVSARLTLNRLVRRHPRTQAAIEAQEIMRPRGWLPTDQSPGTIKPRVAEAIVPNTNAAATVDSPPAPAPPIVAPPTAAPPATPSTQGTQGATP